MKKIFPVPMIRSDDNWLDDINSFMNSIMEELINSLIIISEGPTSSLVWRNNRSNDNYFVGQILIEKETTFYYLKFVFNKRGSFSFGLFSRYNQYPEKPVTQYSLKRILLEGEITPEIFFEKFFVQIKNQLT